MNQAEKRRTGRAIRKRARIELDWIQTHIFPRDTPERERRAAVATARIRVGLEEADRG